MLVVAREKLDVEPSRLRRERKFGSLWEPKNKIKGGSL
jgi:hypothetical protein